jgi:hypothetical protein
MAKQTEIPKVLPKVVDFKGSSVKKYRAVCFKGGCGYSGDWKDTKDEANQDAIEHQSLNQDHKVKVTSMG